MILQFTDGLIEASDPADELFGTERLGKALQNQAGKDLAALIQGVFAEAEQFAAETPFEDDVCLAVME